MGLSDLPSELVSLILLVLAPCLEQTRFEEDPFRYEDAPLYDFEAQRALFRQFILYRQVCQQFRDTIDHILFGPTGLDQALLATLPDPDSTEDQRKLGKVFHPPIVSCALRIKLSFPAELQTTFIADLAHIIACAHLSNLPTHQVVHAVTDLAALWRTTAMYEALKSPANASNDDRQVLQAAITVAAHLGENVLLERLLEILPISMDNAGYDSDASDVCSVSDLVNLDRDYYHTYGYRDRYEQGRHAEKRTFGALRNGSYKKVRLLVGRPVWAAAIGKQLKATRKLLEAGLFDEEFPSHPSQNILQDRTVQQLLWHMPFLLEELPILAGRRCRLVPEAIFNFVAQGRADVIKALLACGLIFCQSSSTISDRDQDVSTDIDTIFDWDCAAQIERVRTLTTGSRSEQDQYLAHSQPMFDTRGTPWDEIISMEEVRSVIFMDAVSVDQTDIAEMLLELGINHSYRYRPVYREIFVEINPVGVAAYRGYDAVIETLLDNGADIEGIGIGTCIDRTKRFPWKRSRPDSPFPSPLSFAAAGGRLHTIDLLLKRGADINSISSKALSPLHAACHANQFRAAEELLKRGADPNHNVEFQRKYREPDGSISALVSAVKNRNAEMVALLLRYQADPNAGPSFEIGTRPPYFCSALAWAIRLDDIEIVELLIEAGADMLTIGLPPPGDGAPENISPALLAFASWNTAMTALLVAHGSPEVQISAPQDISDDIPNWLYNIMPEYDDPEQRAENWTRYRSFFSRIPVR